MEPLTRVGHLFRWLNGQDFMTEGCKRRCIPSAASAYVYYEARHRRNKVCEPILPTDGGQSFIRRDNVGDICVIPRNGRDAHVR
jgi:hypothetical protein